MKKSPFPSLVGLFIAFLVFISASTCNAQTFRIDGPKTYNLTTGDNFSIILMNLIAADYKIYVKVENNTENQLEYYPTPVNMSSQGSGSELVVIYSPHGPAIINARIIFFDSVATRDTVYINGQDARFHDELNPFRIYGANNKEM